MNHVISIGRRMLKLLLIVYWFLIFYYLYILRHFHAKHKSAFNRSIVINKYRIYYLVIKLLQLNKIDSKEKTKLHYSTFGGLMKWHDEHIIFQIYVIASFCNK